MEPSPALDLSKLLTHWNALLMVAVWSAIQTARKVLAPYLTGGAPLARLLPLAPTVLCSIAVWIPGPWLSPDETWGQRVVLGIVLGTLTANLHTVASRLGLHDLLRVEPEKKRRGPTA